MVEVVVVQVIKRLRVLLLLVAMALLLFVIWLVLHCLDWGSWPLVHLSESRNVSTRAAIKAHFQTGDVPSQSDFYDLIDSLAHASEDGLQNFVNVKTKYGALGDGSTDDTIAIQAAIDAQTAIYFPPGNYIASNLTITTDGTMLLGAGQQSKITMKSGSTGALIEGSTNKLQIENMAFAGGSGSYKSTASSAANRSALSIASQVDSVLSKLTISGFDKYGIVNNDSARDQASHLRLTDINIFNCWTGVLLTQYAEYMSANSLSCKNCYIGVELTAGNVTIANSQFVNCGVGLWVRKNGNGNNGHGNVNGCLLNHCTTPIWCDNVENGFNFIGCNLFEGLIILDVCKGVNITNGVIDCDEIRMSGGLRNYVRHNYVPAGYANTITHNYGAVTDDTILEGNYKADGTSWGP
jgi:hypothetical protein